MLKKRGYSHFEMVISFIFFISFLLFIIITLKPFETSTVPYSLIEKIPNTFKNKLNTTLTSFFLKVNAQGIQGDCFYINLAQQTIPRPLKNPLVKNLKGEEKESYFLNNLLYIKSKEEYYTVQFSPEFNTQNPIQGCSQIKDDDYEIGGVDSKKAISYSQLKKFSQTYYSDYEKAKKILGIPKIFDFDLTSKDIKEINMRKTNPRATDVVAKEKIFEVLYPNGTIVNARFIFRIW